MLSKSVLFRTYQQAFEQATGLAVDLLGEAENRPERPEPVNSFCSLVRCAGGPCEGCLVTQSPNSVDGHDGPKTDKCCVGLCRTILPLYAGENLIGFLRTGRVLLEAPNPTKFTEISRSLKQVDPDIDLKPFESAYFCLQVHTPEQYGAMIQLLSMFSDDLVRCYNQLMLQRNVVDASPVLRAKAIMEDHFRETLTLRDISKRVGVSTAHFSVLFKRVTGLNYLEYLARLRIEEAKSLLRNPRYRISEAAFKVGFQSVSQFNRTFRRVCGMSPRAYRITQGSKNGSPYHASGMWYAANPI